MSYSAKFRVAGLAIGVMFALSAVHADASTEEPAGIDLGGTSFSDGFGKLEPGFIYQQYFQYSHFNAINDQNGKKVSVFQGTGIDATVALNQFIYISPIHIAGGVLGLDSLIALVDLNAHFSSTSRVSLKANGFGVGDLTFGPFIQMPPIMGRAGPILSQRFEIDAIAPVGSYNKRDDINQSSGYWSIVPNWAITVIPAPGFEISSRLHYIYNLTNNNPAGSGPAFTIAKNYQAGAAVYDDLSASYAVTPHLDLGVNSYYFQQISQDKMDGDTQRDSETTNFSIGPGLTYAVNKTNFLFANAYLPVVEKNTTDGFHTVFRWVHIF